MGCSTAVMAFSSVRLVPSSRSGGAPTARSAAAAAGRTCVGGFGQRRQQVKAPATGPSIPFCGRGSRPRLKVFEEMAKNKWRLV